MDDSLLMIFTCLIGANLFGLVCLSVKLDRILEKIEEVLRWM